MARERLLTAGSYAASAVIALAVVLPLAWLVQRRLSFQLIQVDPNTPGWILWLAGILVAVALAAAVAVGLPALWLAGRIPALARRRLAAATALAALWSTALMVLVTPFPIRPQEGALLTLLSGVFYGVLFWLHLLGEARGRARNAT